MGLLLIALYKYPYLLLTYLPCKNTSCRWCVGTGHWRQSAARRGETEWKWTSARQSVQTAWPSSTLACRKYTSRHNEREVIFCSEFFYCIWQDGKKVTKLENTVVEVNGWWCWLQRFNVDHQSGRPTYTTFTDGRRSMSLQLSASGFDPRDIRVLVDWNQLIIDATHSESHSSRDVTSDYTSDVTRRRLSRRYLLPGHVRASDLHCRLTSDGTLITECQVCSPGSNNNVTSPGDGLANKSRSSKQVRSICHCCNFVLYKKLLTESVL